MGLLTKATRKKWMKMLGYDYIKSGILKMQRDYFKRKQDCDGIYGADTDKLLRHLHHVKVYAPSFKPEEFRCPCGHCTGYPTWMRVNELKNLQKIRDHYKKPMTITSGLRCSYENSRVGGVRNSGHTRGYAADFYMKGVTDTVEHRKSALSYMKKLDNHEFTYGAYMKDSNGMYRTASGMGNAMHTETHKPEPTKADKILIACKAQANWMKNYKYSWESNPTIAKSKKKGTCVTYVACVLQRLGYLKSGQYIWHDSKGKVTHANSKMSVMYPNRKIKSCRSILKAGDVIIAGSKHDVGSGSHIFVFTGKWSGTDPIIWDNHSCERVKKGKSGAHTYDGNKHIIAVVRLK